MVSFDNRGLKSTIALHCLLSYANKRTTTAQRDGQKLKHAIEVYSILVFLLACTMGTPNNMQRHLFLSTMGMKAVNLTPVMIQ